MDPITRGDIVLVPFPYADLRGQKRRPAYVVSADAYQQGPDLIVVMVTSQAARRDSPGLGDVVVADWMACGLRAPSTIRTGRLLFSNNDLSNRRWGDSPSALRPKSTSR